MASLSSTKSSTSNQTYKTSIDKKPPLAPPSKLRPALRKITNFMPNPSPLTSNKKSMMSYLPVVNEEKENISRPLPREKPVMKARRSIAVTPQEAPQHKRRASIATFRPENSTHMTTPLHNSSARLRTDRVGRQSFVWDPQRMWRTSRASSAVPQQSEGSTVLATPVGHKSSKFRGSPPSHAAPGSWKPKHPTVVALQKKQLIWSPLKLRDWKNKRTSFLSSVEVRRMGK